MEEGESIGRGGCGPFSGLGPDQFGLCRWEEKVRGVGQIRLASRIGKWDTGAVGYVVVRVVAAGGRDSPFDRPWVMCTFGQEPERSRSLVGSEPGPANFGSIAAGGEGMLESICLGFFSCHFVGPLCDGDVGLNRNSRRRCRR